MTAYLVTIAVLVSISALIGLGLNIQWGLCGLVNFGVVGFFSLSAYSAALISLYTDSTALGLIGAMLVSAGFSALLALLAIRLSDDYLAIVTLGFGELVRLVLLNESWLTGGALGISAIPQPLESLTAGFEYNKVYALLCLAALAVVFIVAELLTRSPFGRLLRAVRDDDTVAAALGKNVLLQRVKAFAIGGAMIGVAGTLHAYYLTYIDPSQFTPIVTAYAFMAVIAGGRGSNTGLLIGAGSIMLLLEGSRFLKDFISIFDGTQLAAFRLAMIGVGIKSNLTKE